MVAFDVIYEREGQVKVDVTTEEFTECDDERNYINTTCSIYRQQFPAGRINKRCASSVCGLTVLAMTSLLFSTKIR